MYKTLKYIFDNIYFKVNNIIINIILYHDIIKYYLLDNFLILKHNYLKFHI